jgi:sugar phosphate isomerase/epimerase
MTRYGVILFHTNSSVMRAEKLLKKAGYSIKLIPTPREFSSDCGVALRFDWADYEQVKLILDTAHLEIEAIHQM